LPQCPIKGHYLGTMHLGLTPYMLKSWITPLLNGRAVQISLLSKIRLTIYPKWVGFGCIYEDLLQ